MAREAMILLIICLLALKIPVSMASQAPDPYNCTVSITSLISCLPYLTVNVDNPSIACCSSLESFDKIAHAAGCLCTLIAIDPRLGLFMNRTRILDAPARCNISVTNVKECEGLGFAPVVPSVTNSNVTGSNLSNGAPK
ncbi:hypothetical protein SUGI_0072520, partial [Cryptomeria japonica]